MCPKWHLVSFKTSYSRVNLYFFLNCILSWHWNSLIPTTVLIMIIITTHLFNSKYEVGAVPGILCTLPHIQFFKWGCKLFLLYFKLQTLCINQASSRWYFIYFLLKYLTYINNMSLSWRQRTCLYLFTVFTSFKG